MRFIYDPLVVRFANRVTWGCPSQYILDLYDSHGSDDHLDVGPGTGWFLCHWRPAGREPQIALLDINRAVLAVAERRLASASSRHPERFVADLLKPINLGARRFDSIGLTHVLHCLPGTMTEKASAFDNLRPLLRPGGKLFGSTILSDGVRHGRLAQAQLNRMNETEVFDNRSDSLADLEKELAARFTRYELVARGSVGLFSATA